ncbi:MAG TPA: glycosyltransferase family 9 protein [Gallionellaceae bacterium]|nr:glycosyltransferase family 9 protein [Gallionellaceae bacterium]
MSSPSGLNIAVVRFSALGDVAMAVPAVRHLQRSFPGATITWITSPLCYALLHGLEGVQFVVCDKPRSFADYRAFYRLFSARRFDAVLAMQANLRINLLYPALHAPRKIGFDRTRAREGQWLFCNQRIPFADNHLVDSFMAFATTLGAPPTAPDCSLPISTAERERARAQLAGLPRPLIAIHPFASKAERNWPLERLAEVIRLASKRWQAGFLLTGGNSAAEREGCAQLAGVAPQHTLNLCGQTEPKQLAALLGEADVLIAPDTGPVHLARAMETPVIGLYAVASPGLCGPYAQQQYVVDRYPQAVRQFLRKDPTQLPWNTRVHHPEAMKLIQVEDVMTQLERVLQPHA